MDLMNVLITKDNDGRFVIKACLTSGEENSIDTSDTIVEIHADYVQQTGNIITTING